MNAPHTIREQLRSVLIHQIAPAFTGTPLAQQRAMLDGMGAEAVLPSGITVEAGQLAGVPLERLVPAEAAERTLLYFHGGGYVMGSCTSHRALAAQIGVACRATVVLPDYRLAPEHPFPAGQDDCLAVYRALLEQGHPAGSVVLIGDSAGGGMTAAVLLRIRDAGLPQPRAAVMLSPWTDLTLSGETFQTRKGLDPWLSEEMFAPHVESYLGTHDRADPLASPLFAALEGLPPLLIQVGDHELLLSDATRLAERAQAAGVRVELQVWDALWHVWQLFAPQLPEANEAIAAIGAFVEQQLR